MFNFKAQASKIEGWLTKREGMFLYESAKNVLPPRTIVEIGAWKGRSTICLAQGTKDGNKVRVFSIDPHTGSSEHIKMFGNVSTFEEFITNLRNSGSDAFVIPVKNTSERACVNFNEPIGFLFIDGAHEYELVSQDYRLWFPKLVNNGFVAFHDSWHTFGVNFFTSKLLLTSNNIKDPKLIDTLTVITKVEKNGLKDRLYNILFVIYRLLFGYIGTFKIAFLGGTVVKRD